MPNGKQHTCTRGHIFYKSSDCPVCPKCWSGYYKKKALHDFPPKLVAPPLRALQNANISSLAQLVKYDKSEIASLHGIGPTAIAQLQSALKVKKLTFKK